MSRNSFWSFKFNVWTKICQNFVQVSLLDIARSAFYAICAHKIFWRRPLLAGILGFSARGRKRRGICARGEIWVISAAHRFAAIPSPANCKQDVARSLQVNILIFSMSLVSPFNSKEFLPTIHLKWCARNLECESKIARGIISMRKRSCRKRA